MCIRDRVRIYSINRCSTVSSWSVFLPSTKSSLGQLFRFWYYVIGGDLTLWCFSTVPTTAWLPDYPTGTICRFCHVPPGGNININIWTGITFERTLTLERTSTLNEHQHLTNITIWTLPFERTFNIRTNIPIWTNANVWTKDACAGLTPKPGLHFRHYSTEVLKYWNVWPGEEERVKKYLYYKVSLRRRADVGWRKVKSDYVLAAEKKRKAHQPLKFKRYNSCR